MVVVAVAVILVYVALSYNTSSSTSIIGNSGRPVVVERILIPPFRFGAINVSWTTMKANIVHLKL